MAPLQTIIDPFVRGMNGQMISALIGTWTCIRTSSCTSCIEHCKRRTRMVNRRIQVSMLPPTSIRACQFGSLRPMSWGFFGSISCANPMPNFRVSCGDLVLRGQHTSRGPKALLLEPSAARSLRRMAFGFLAWKRVYRELRYPSRAPSASTTSTPFPRKPVSTR